MFVDIAPQDSRCQIVEFLPVPMRRRNPAEGVSAAIWAAKEGRCSYNVEELGTPRKNRRNRSPRFIYRSGEPAG